MMAYRDSAGRILIEDWLDDLAERDSRAYVKCLQRLRQLRDTGHELRRPIAAPLRDGICELRAQIGTVNYRVLYFFHGKNVVVLSHGLTKEDAVPPVEIDRAVQRMKQVQNSPERFTAAWEE
jgi:phage-related protein